MTHTLKRILRIKINERIKNKRIYLNRSRLFLYSYAKMSKSYKYMNI